MKIAIHQPHYLPWVPYFDKIAKCDLFIFLDDVEFSKGSFQNRCEIPTTHGDKYLTVPLLKHKSDERIDKLVIAEQHNWRRKHLRTLEMFHSKLEHYNVVMTMVRNILGTPTTNFAQLSMNFVVTMCEMLGINVDFVCASEFKVKGKKTEKIIKLCEEVDGDEYISGPDTKNYLDVGLMREHCIEVTWQDYEPPNKYSIIYNMMLNGREIF